MVWILGILLTQLAPSTHAEESEFRRGDVALYFDENEHPEMVKILKIKEEQITIKRGGLWSDEYRTVSSSALSPSTLERLNGLQVGDLATLASETSDTEYRIKNVFKAGYVNACRDEECIIMPYRNLKFAMTGMDRLKRAVSSLTNLPTLWWTLLTSRSETSGLASTENREEITSPSNSDPQPRSRARGL